MWIENEIYLEDLKNNVFAENIKWNLLKSKTIFVTGGTGLIGSSFINTILYANKTLKLNCKVIALVRDIKKAEILFKQQLNEKIGLNLIEGDVSNPININEKIDYILHAASQTSSKLFVEDPVGTINVSLKGTKNTLKLALKNNVQNYIFLSTMEVYGTPHTDEKIAENHVIDLNTMDVRNCYPISKIMCENLCTCYANQFKFNTNVLRLTQTFGSGVNYNDGRVFAEFARCAIEGKDIILHTKGKTKRSYLYTSDAVNAILLVMLKGQNLAVYNVANEDTYCSILEMAKLVAKKSKEKNIEVKCIIEENLEKFGYAPTLCMNLDTTKLKKLGWGAKIDLNKMYDRLIEFMKETK